MRRQCGGGGRGRGAHVDASAHAPQVVHRQRAEVEVAPPPVAVAGERGWAAVRWRAVRTLMVLPTFCRLFIVSEVRLGLRVTCRGGVGAGLGSDAVWGGEGRGGPVRRGGRGRGAHQDTSEHVPQAGGRLTSPLAPSSIKLLVTV